MKMMEKKVFCLFEFLKNAEKLPSAIEEPKMQEGF